MLSTRQIDRYRSQGFIVVEDVLARDVIGELRAVTDGFVERSRALRESDDVFDLEPGHTPEKPRLRRLKSPASHHPAYARALRHPKILDIVAQLIGSGIRYNGDKLNMKCAGFGSPVQWHQDWAYYPHTNDDLLAVGVALDDMTVENGCPVMIPRSHLGPVLDHHQNGVFIGAVTDPRFRPEPVVATEVRAGGVTIHHVRTVHGSEPNRSDRQRRLLLFQYCALDAFPLLGVTDWDAFNACVLRGEPTCEFRAEAVPVRIPRLYAEGGGSIYDVQSLLERPFFERTNR